MTNERERIVDMMASMLADDQIVAAVRSGTHRLVPRETLERYERAEWALIERAGYPGPVRGWPELVELGLATCNGNDWQWTEAAHEFAARMREKDGK